MRKSDMADLLAELARIKDGGADFSASKVARLAGRVGRRELVTAFSSLAVGVSRREEGAIKQARALAARYVEEILGEERESREHQRPTGTPERHAVIEPSRAPVTPGMSVLARLTWSPKLSEEAAYCNGVLASLTRMFSVLSSVVDELGADDPDAVIHEHMSTTGAADNCAAVEPLVPEPSATTARRRTVLRLEPPARVYDVRQLENLEEFVREAAATVRNARRSGRQVTVSIVVAVQISATRALTEAPEAANKPICSASGPTARCEHESDRAPSHTGIDAAEELSDDDLDILENPDSWLATGT